MKRLTALVGATLTAIGTLAQNGMPRTSPEEQGIPSAAISAFVDSVMSIPDAEIHHIVIARHGSIVAEIHPKPFRPEDGHTLFSCSKTFVAAAVGIAVGENRLRVTDRVVALLPDALGGDTISPRVASMTVEDLLTMRAGFRPTNKIRETCDDWTRAYMKNTMVAPPGTRFAYDSMATYLLSAIVSRVTGMPLIDYLNSRLFGAMGITDAVWESSPEGVSCGGWGLYLTAESMTKFGQCLLNRGRYGGRQLISPEWVDQMMSVHVAEKGYGYQTWKCANPMTMRADGAHGQFIIVMPREDMVCTIAQCITAAAPGNREQRHLFDIIGRSLSPTPLPSDKRAQRALQTKLDKLTLQPAMGKTRAKAPTRTTIAPDTTRKEWARLGWREISLSQSNDTLTLAILDSAGRTVTIPCLNGEWAYSAVPTTFPHHPRGTVRGAFSGFDGPFAAAASYGWMEGGELRLRILFVDWISGLDIRISPTGEGRARMRIKRNFDKEWMEMEGEMRQRHCESETRR